MQVTGKVVVVTGGANGIGRALCEAFHRAGAAKVSSPISISTARGAVAASIDGAAFKCDVGQEKDILHVIEETERQFGPIALFCSNAGIGGGFDPLSENAGGTSDEPWARSWAIHVMAHVYAARHLIPRMKARGGGYFLNTISAAGLLSQVGSPAYSTTKHAAVGFAENLAISHKADGIKVSILCPQGVDTNMLRSIPKGPQSGDGDLTPEQVAQDALAGIEQETFRDSAAPAGARLHAQEDRELRPLDRGHGEDPGEDAGRFREVIAVSVRRRDGSAPGIMRSAIPVSHRGLPSRRPRKSSSPCAHGLRCSSLGQLPQAAGNLLPAEIVKRGQRAPSFRRQRQRLDPRIDPRRTSPSVRRTSISLPHHAADARFFQMQDIGELHRGHRPAGADLQDGVNGATADSPSRPASLP